MKLDFTTLYVVVLLNSLMLSIIWGSIAGTYRNFLAARYWLASSLINTVGDLILLHSSGPYALLAAITGNALVIFGWRPEHPEDQADIMADADAALYASKTAGRNTVTMAAPAAIDTTAAPALGSSA